MMLGDAGHRVFREGMAKPKGHGPLAPSATSVSAVVLERCNKRSMK